MAIPPGAKWMSEKQVAEIVALARADTPLWQQLLHREAELEALSKLPEPEIGRDPVLTKPDMVELVHLVVDRHLGKGHGYVGGQAIIPIRRELRIQLGYQV